MRVFRVRAASWLSLAFAAVLALGAEMPPPVRLEVDAREAPRKIFHAKLWIPARPGPLTLLYPKWLPGEHGPTGPIADLAGVKIHAGGRPVAWRRDPVDMYAFHCEVPPGADSVEVALDYLSPAGAGGFSSGSSATEQLAVISWNQMLLYPKGARDDQIQYAATLKLPAGWKHATALAAGKDTPEGIQFEPVPLTTLVDSPVLAGAHFRVVTLSEGPVAHRLNIAADSEAALAISPDEIQRYKSLVEETGALFGARHYRHYDFLLTLSDRVTHFGLEHHESSDDRVAERALIDEQQRKGMAGLLPHEMVHSWNGKYRRPAGLEPGHFHEPMKGNLLWVYEGLTQYLGQILTARSGLLTPEELRENLAQTAAEMDYRRGRSWRPLEDTAAAAQILYGSRPDWASWRRGTDFYPESELLWLEADTIIRRQTQGRRSLDDFCRLFFGGKSGPPAVVPYAFEDVLVALNHIAPYDWKGFWTEHLESTAPHAPLGGIAAGGWKLVYGEARTGMQKAAEERSQTLDARFSIGISVGKDGAIPDVIPGSPAARAGIGPGMKLVAVNGRRWTREILHEALKATRTQPIELLVENGGFFRSCRLDWSGGERYPRLEREEGKPDLLSQILRPRASGAEKSGKARAAR